MQDMKTNHRNWSRPWVWQGLVVIGWLTVASAILATPAHAYIGPGSGLSAIGSLLALIAAIVVAIVGFVWFPLKRIMRKRKPAAGLAREDGGNEGPK